MIGQPEARERHDDPIAPDGSKSGPKPRDNTPTRHWGDVFQEGGALAGLLVGEIGPFEVKRRIHTSELEVVANTGVDEEVSIRGQFIVRMTVLGKCILAFQPRIERSASIF